MLKKLISLLLCAIMVSSLIPAAGVFASSVTGDISVEVFGGTVSFDGKEDAFDGKASAGDILRVALTEQDGRVFKCWKTRNGAEIPEKDFTMFVTGDEAIYAVFADTSDYPFDWTLLFDGNCVEGDLYKGVNEKVDVALKTEYPEGGWHDFSECEYVDEEYHAQVCKNCGYKELNYHHFSDEVVTKEATHGEEGIKTAKCYSCGKEITTVIPKTEQHVFGPWEIVEPSVNGQYGKRARKCLYCDHTETYWYLGIDYKALLQNHYVNYVYAYGGKKCHNEQYYHYVNDKGLDVYVMALQYVYEYSSGNDGGTTWIFTYVDDSDSTTLDPVYLSRSYGDTMPEYVQAHYGWVYDLDGFLRELKFMDHFTGNMTGVGYFGNSMSARSSSLLSWSDDWAEEFNDALIPVDKDPSSFLTTSGGFKIWEVDGEHVNAAGYSVYIGEDGEGNSQYATYGGFNDCTAYRKCVIDYGEDNRTYDYITVDNKSGIAVSKTVYTTQYRSQFYYNEYKEIVDKETYDQLDEKVRHAYVCKDDIESKIKTFCSNRNNFGSFTLTIPEKPKAVRLLTDADPSFNKFVNVEGYGQTMAVSYNNARVVYVPQSAQFPDEKKIVFTWNDAYAASQGKIFDRWEIWNVRTEKWETVSTNKSVTLNTYSDPLTEATYFRYIAHNDETTYHIKVTEGYFTVGDDHSTQYTEADVPKGKRVELIVNYRDGWETEGWQNEKGEKLSSYYFNALSDGVYTPIWIEVGYSFYVEAYEGYGHVWEVGKEEEKGSYIEAYGKLGETVRFMTEGDEDEGYTEFLGWYALEWGKGDGEATLKLLSKDLELAYEVKGGSNPDIKAVWSDGTVSVEPKRTNVYIQNGFIYPQQYGKDPGLIPEGEEAPAYPFPNAYSSLSVGSYVSVLLIDDPTDDHIVEKWNVRFNAEKGEETYEMASDPYYNEFFAESTDRYADGQVFIEGVFVERCGDDEHVWNEGHVKVHATTESVGEKVFTCTICGEKKTEEIPVLIEYEIIEGNNAVWEDDGSDDGTQTFVIRSNSDYETFVEVRADGTVVPMTYYTVSGGSTVVTFTSDFLDYLGEGEHTITVVATDGVANALITVKSTGVIYGDANGDKRVTALDIVRLKKYLASYDPEKEEYKVTVSQGADANGDSLTDSLDVVLLKKYFAEYNVLTGQSSVKLGPLGDNDGWSPDIL